MPRGDGTGPAGLGPMTGRAAGYCAGYAVPGYLNPLGGRFPRAAFGVGIGRGGRGYRNFYYATGLPGYVRYSMGLPAWGGAGYVPNVANPFFSAQNIDAKQETELLKNQAEFLNQQLNNIQARLSELENAGKTEKNEETK
ncbi:MAG: DUF5320 domain-containing protein [Actinobacteria bacterium]|nr:DUF5320 domain-containing protein [Cyanobacteriota bacterium]MCL5771480.1 DUF5320 domain-containing protein [Actinomycetota bacterium]